MPWRELARRLADAIAAEGCLRDPAWRAAVEATPRHVFVPRFHTQQPGGDWQETTSDTPGWLEAVYRNQPLVTALVETSRGNRVIVSSSSKPALMVRMLEALDVHEGRRVLEIGTGTGYNVALLAHRLGGDRVFSVDIGAALVAAARGRLAMLGLTPRLAVAEGARGLPRHAPFDRIIATCSVPAVPWAWAEQLVEGGLVLVDLKRSAHGGNLVLLRRYPDRLEGRFLPKWAGFMAIRESDTTPEFPSSAVEIEAGRSSRTALDPTPHSALVAWFLAHATFPAGLTFGYRGFDDGGPSWAVVTAADGSWCAVRMRSAGDGSREVRQAGPVAIWDGFEHAYQQWQALDRPGWDRLGLTVLPDGLHRLWLDDPESGQRWILPSIP